MSVFDQLKKSVPNAFYILNSDRLRENISSSEGPGEPQWTKSVGRQFGPVGLFLSSSFDIRQDSWLFVSPGSLTWQPCFTLRNPLTLCAALLHWSDVMVTTEFFKSIKNREVCDCDSICVSHLGIEIDLTQLMYLRYVGLSSHLHGENKPGMGG